MYHEESLSHAPISNCHPRPQSLHVCAIFSFSDQNGSSVFAVQALGIVTSDENSAYSEALSVALKVWPLADGWEKHGAVVNQFGTFRAFAPAFG